MATVVETVERNGEIINIYENGAEYSVTRKCLVKGPRFALITTENASALNRRRRELKQERLMLGAVDRLMNGRTDRIPDDLDVVQALGSAAMARAMDTNIKNNKQIDAMRFLLHETGLSEEQQSPAAPGTINVVVMSDDVFRFLRDVRSRLVSERDISASKNDADSRVIDGSVLPPTDQDQQP